MMRCQSERKCHGSCRDCYLGRMAVWGWNRQFLSWAQRQCSRSILQQETLESSSTHQRAGTIFRTPQTPLPAVPRASDSHQWANTSSRTPKAFQPEIPKPVIAHQRGSIIARTPWSPGCPLAYRHQTQEHYNPTACLVRTQPTHQQVNTSSKVPKISHSASPGSIILVWADFC